jgi:DNA-binding MarR family transcriptional regulator
MDEDLNRLEDAMLLFFQTMKRPQRWTEITEQIGTIIDRPSGQILHILAPPGTTYGVQELASHLGIEAPSVTRKTQELEQSGYISRVRSSKDKRAVTLQITPAGRNLAHKITKVRRESMRSVLYGWSDTDRLAFINYFERFSSEIANT